MDLLEVYKKKKLKFHVEPNCQQRDVLGIDTGIIRFPRRQLGATTATALRALDESYNKENSVHIVASNENNLRYIADIIKRTLEMNGLEFISNREYIQIKGKPAMLLISMASLRKGARRGTYFTTGFTIADIWDYKSGDNAILQSLSPRLVMCLGGVSSGVS